MAPRVLLTGQHDGLALQDYGFPGIPAVQLHCRGKRDPKGHARKVADAIQPHLGGTSLLLVQGDTSSALGGALAANGAGVPVGHVEAGLRSHDARHPWPEEDFRITIDRLSALLFAPTELSAANLRREGIAGAIHVTGNTGVDAALARPLQPRTLRDGSCTHLLVTCHRRESWGEALASIAGALRELAMSDPVSIRFILHPNPSVAAAMRGLLDRRPGILLSPPCSHEDMLQAMLDCDLVLTDSGGLQEEAPIFGIPLLVLRERTERPEAIATGNMELVGTQAQRIVAAVRRLIRDPHRLARMSLPARPHGDGRASARIADVAARWTGLPATRAA